MAENEGEEARGGAISPAIMGRNGKRHISLARQRLWMGQGMGWEFQTCPVLHSAVLQHDQCCKILVRRGGCCAPHNQVLIERLCRRSCANDPPVDRKHFPLIILFCSFIFCFFFSFHLFSYFLSMFAFS